MMSKLESNDRWQTHTLGAGALGLILAAAYFFGVHPTLKQHRARLALQSQIASSGRAFAVLDGSRSRLTRERADANAALDLKTIKLTSRRTENTRIAALNSLATECGLRLDGLLPGQPEERELYGVVPIVMSGRGGFTRCATLLHRLVSELPDMHAVGFSLEAEQLGAETDARFRFDLVWYVDREDVAPRQARQ